MLAAILVGVGVGLLIPLILGTGRWVRGEVVKTLNEGRQLAADNKTELIEKMDASHKVVMAKFGEIEAEAESAARRDNVRFTKLEIDSAEAIKAISFLQGVQSERAATARAAIDAAAVIQKAIEERP